jgi:hypothetical protein
MRRTKVEYSKNTFPKHERVKAVLTRRQVNYFNTDMVQTTENKKSLRSLQTTDTIKENINNTMNLKASLK